MSAAATDKSRLNEAAKANLETGVLLLAKEFLVTAIQDSRLERGHLRVLACIATLINRTSAKAWPSRAIMASMTGMTEKSVSNTLSELRNLGYLVDDRERVAEANNRILKVYTLGNIDHDAIRAEITKFCLQMQRARGAAGIVDATQTAEFPVHGEQAVPRPRGSSPYTGHESSPPTGRSNSVDKKLNRGAQKGARATKLPADWMLPREWADWAKTHFAISDDRLRKEAASFRDHWCSTADTRKDWFATWRNWLRADWKKLKVRVPEDSVAADARKRTPDPAFDDWRANLDPGYVVKGGA